jgi:metal-responsive CopG/Arc/MetJ family transcriptional regulator
MAVNPDRMTRKLVSIPNEMLRAIDDFRFQQRIRTESEAIRRLIDAGLGKSGPATRSTRGPGGMKKSRSAGKSASKRQ